MKTGEAVIDLAMVNAYLLKTVETLSKSLEQAAPFLHTPAARAAAARLAETGLEIVAFERSSCKEQHAK